MISKNAAGPYNLSYAVFLTALIFLSYLMTTVSANGSEIEGVNFENQKKMDGMELKLRGLGLMRYMVFFKVSVAGLYMPEDIASEQVLSDVPKILELYYFHPISAKEFIEMTNTWMKKNVKSEIMEKLRPSIDRYNNLFKDVVPKDRYRLTYWPGKGTDLALNGKVLGNIEGSDFASALFSIWLGPVPVSRSAKAGLLGDR